MYGILVVEDGNELYQIIGEVASPDEAHELALDYARRASPDNEDAQCQPSEFIVWRRSPSGSYTSRVTIDIG